MTTYMTEEEQIENIKKWWKKYGNMASTLFLIAMLAILGWKYWNQYLANVHRNASMHYEGMIQAVANDKKTDIEAQANSLIASYPKTIYADVAKLQLAKLKIESGKLDGGAKLLSDVIVDNRDSSLTQVARLRLARILMAQKHYQRAKQQLAIVDDNAYMPLILEQKGDLELAQGNLQQANQYYTQAAINAPKSGAVNPMLKIKINDTNTKTMHALKQTANNTPAFS